MALSIITGSSGPVGGVAARFFSSKGLDIVGLDNNSRAYFVGTDVSTDRNTAQLRKKLSNETQLSVDVRDFDSVRSLIRGYGRSIKLIIHASFRFQRFYPGWSYHYDLDAVVRQIIVANAERERIKV